MTRRWLEVFLVVAKHLSVTLAAQELHVTQPTISQQLKLLQNNVGARLLKKTRTGIALTPVGVAFRKEAEAILSRLDALGKRYAVPAVEPAEKVLAIGASYGPSASLIPDLMTRYAASHPTVNLRLYRVERTRIENLLMKSKIEIAVTTYPVHRATLKSEPFRTERLSAFVTPDHPFARLKEVKIGELSKTRLVVKTGKENESRTEKLLRDLCKSGHRPKIAMRCESPEALKTAVRNGAGVGILFYDSIREEVRRNEFVVVKLAGIEIKSRSVYCKKKPLSKPAQEFLALLRASRHIDQVIRLGAKPRRVSSPALRGSEVA